MSPHLSPKDFGEQLIALLPKLMQEIARYENNYVTSGKITCQQFLILSELAHKEKMRMNELVEAMNSSFPVMTGIINRLVNHKLVTRLRDEQDRRVVTVSITPKGRNIVKEVYAQKKKGIIEIFGRLSSHERSQYLEILQKVVQKLSGTKGR